MRISQEEKYNTRCTISHRPSFRSGEPLLFRCPCCHQMTVVHPPLIENPPIPEISCCGQRLEKLQICQDKELIETHKIRYTVFGGFDNTSTLIEVEGGLHPMEAQHRIEWIYLRTFQGGQMKYLPERGRSKAIYSFADEDAYVYCDRDVCRMGREHCQFQCRRGTAAYAYCSQHGLFRVEFGDVRPPEGMDRTSAYTIKIGEK